MSIETFGLKRDIAHAGKAKVENIQALRGIACLLVLIHHMGVYEGIMFKDRALIAGPTYPFMSGVHLFFIISGFVMVTITSGRFQQPGGSAKFLLRRVARIYPIYWFFTLVYLPIYILKPALFTRAVGLGSLSAITTALLIPHMGILVGQTLIGQAWTLIFEMYFYVIFALALLVPESQRMRLLLVWGAATGVAAWLAAGLVGTPREIPVVPDPMALEFLAGCLLAWLIGRGEHRWAVPALIAAPVLFLVLAHFQTYWDRVLIFLPPFALLTYGAVAVEARHGFHFPLWLRRAGDISYSLYLSHILTLSVFRNIWGRTIWRHRGRTTFCFSVSRGPARSWSGRQVIGGLRNRC